MLASPIIPKKDVVIFMPRGKPFLSHRRKHKTVKSGSLPQEGSKGFAVSAYGFGQSFLSAKKTDEYGALKIDILYTVEAGRSALEVEV